MFEDIGANFARTEAVERGMLYPEPPKDCFEDDLMKCEAGNSARAAMATNLMNLCRNVKEPLRIMLDGAWGSGKSWFLDRLADDFEQNAEDFITVKINAWKIDHATDPFMAFASEISEQVEVFQDEVKWAMSRIIKGIYYASSVSAGFYRFDPGKFAEKMDAKDDFLQEGIDTYLKTTRARDELIAAFSNVLNGELEMKLVIFIDELDRCEPRFAITLLERVKHFFEARGVVVVAAVDKIQLEHCIKVK
ncbi:KAP family P-loop NTPase fold protein [Cerasicoccus maritimus]|uniref:KAP family P-loop NTPase fold protein n=1 Tax=Cerasicoccus maritimus TaxID=490089 RepID=UPI0028528240|nr:P-loop NTPase fold protein [Cerasicoccus maritimus]